MTTDWTNGVRSPAEAKDFSSNLCVQTSSEAHPASCAMGTEESFLWIESGPERDADLLPPFSVEFVNEQEV
jgi:hypothetical protein